MSKGRSRPPTLSGKERIILDLLLDGPKFGLQLVEQSGGRLKYGTVYVTLSRMEDKGYVESEPFISPVEVHGASKRDERGRR
jgi:DNA-binding PadR family transcriptional regulator